MRLKWPKSYENPKKITRLKFKKITVYLLTYQKLTLTQFCSDSENKFLSLLLIEEILKIFFFTFHICLNIFHMVKTIKSSQMLFTSLPMSFPTTSGDCSASIVHGASMAASIVGVSPICCQPVFDMHPLSSE